MEAKKEFQRRVWSTTVLSVARWQESKALHWL